MRWGAAAATLAGLALAGWLLAHHGLPGILGLLRQAGWGIGLVVAFHLLQLLASSEAWRAATGRQHPRPGVLAFLLLRWVREGINTMLPVAQIGGEVVGARLLHRRGVPLPAAVAGSVGDVAVGMLTQALFTLIGLGLLVALVGMSVTAAWLLAGTVAALAGAALLAAGVRYGWAGRPGRWLSVRVRRAATRGIPGLRGIGAAFRALGRDRRALARCGGLHMVSWLLGGSEVWLALHVLGKHAGFSEALAIEALGQAIRTAGFVIPGALGVAEGGYVLVCALFGLPPDVAIALALMKRLREVAFGLPALLAWQVMEARPVFSPTAAVRTDA
jgi:putative membrane protein